MQARSDLEESEADKIAKEYEEFAYIVSHDLNAPIRHIKEFTRLLISSRGNTPNEEEQEYVKYLGQALDKINVMQEALLTFSRLNTEKLEATRIDCNNIAQIVIDSLESNGRKNTDKIMSHDLPTIEANPRHIHNLFFHLFDNAIKFHDKKAKDIQVEVLANEGPQEWIFEVKDNGIGIPEDQQENVFRLFRRLRPDDYEGAGTGLTFAKKILSFYGGDIWIQTRSSSQGTKVLFSFPKT